MSYQPGESMIFVLSHGAGRTRLAPQSGKCVSSRNVLPCSASWSTWPLFSRSATPSRATPSGMRLAARPATRREELRLDLDRTAACWRAPGVGDGLVSFAWRGCWTGGTARARLRALQLLDGFLISVWCLLEIELLSSVRSFNASVMAERGNPAPARWRSA